MTEPHVFISYDRTDQGAAEQVRARLLANQVKTWMDRYDIPAGAYWPDEIDVGLCQATLILGLLSPDAVTSRNVKNEWDWAIHNSKPLILLKIRPSETPHRYVSINYIDATKHGLDTALDQLMRIPDLQSAPGPVVAASAPSPVVAVPQTEFVERGGLTIAYHVLGGGDIDLIYVPGSVSHVEQLWKLPAMAAFLRGLASFSRVMLVDVRGTGLSSRPARIASLEERMDDLCAVMDACQSERAVLFGVSGGAPLAILFAATYPKRTRALVLYGGRASYVRQTDYPWAKPLENQRRAIEADSKTIDTTWGTRQAARAVVQSMAPSAQDDESLVTWLAELQRLGSSPSAEIARRRMDLETDVRHILSAVRTPTLVLHRTVDLEANIGEGRYIAGHIPGATFEELPGVDHLIMVGDQESVVTAIERFVRGSSGAGVEEHGRATKLATVAWIETGGIAPEALLDVAQREIESYQGRITNPNSNGIAAVFDGPARALRYADALSDALTTRGATVSGGVQTGELEMGESEVAGPTLQVAQQLAKTARPGQILVTDQVRTLVAGTGMRFEAAPPSDPAPASGAAEILLVDRDSLS